MSEEPKRRLADRLGMSPTVISESTTVIGDIETRGPLMVSGHVQGNGKIGGTLSMSKSAAWHGDISAKQAVLAVNAWGVGWPQLNRRLVAWSSYIVLTAPAPDRLREIGWTGGELISDFRVSLRYFRTTPDGRIAFGGGGGRARRTVDDMFTHDARAVRETAEGFRLMFPSFADVPIEDAWGGPIDVSPTHLPTFGRAGSSNVYFACGYTGNGVAPTRVAGEALADLITGADTDAARLPMVNARPPAFPPEPFRSWGAMVVRRAMIAKETAEEQGRVPGFFVSQVARTPRRMGYLLGPD